MRQKFNPTISYIDLVFNLALAFVVLFIIAILMIKPPAKTGEIEVRDAFLITMDWNDESNYDMDMHILQPDGNHVYFSNRESLQLSLERDDLGKINDSSGVLLNREVIHIRKLEDGNYVVNVHFYKNQSNETIPQQISFEFLQIDPRYEVILNKKIQYQLSELEEYTLFSFTVSGGKIIQTDVNNQMKIVKP